MALDLTHRMARHANTRSLTVSASAGSPETSFHAFGCVAWSVNQIDGLYEQTAVNLTELGLGLRRLRHLQDTQVLLLGLEQFKRIGVVIGRDDDFGED